MIVDLKTVSTDPRQIDFTLGADWWNNQEEDDQILGFDSPLEVQIKISLAGSRYVIEGSFSGILIVKCDRCLEPYRSDFESTFNVVFTVAGMDTGQTEVELEEENMSVDFITSDEISLDDIVREQLYLSLPMKCLCREDCNGLCPECGNNLNLEKCECQKESRHPGFLKLKKLIPE